VLPGSVVRRPQWIPRRPDTPGIVLATVLGALSLLVIRVLPPSPFVSDILVALVLGALIVNTGLRRVIGIELPSEERQPDRYATGLRFTGKWVLRLAIILMGFKVQTKLFGMAELALIGGVAVAALPSVFFVTHAIASTLGLRRAMADLLAGGTMICGASAVNAVAPIAGAHREEQGLAIGTIFLFSVVALVTFRPIAAWVGLDAAHAGLWSGLAVNDLSSAIAVGKQMGEAGGVMAAASKSARVLMLAPLLIVLSLLRSDGKPRSVKNSIVEQLPGYLLGYIALAIVRAAGDRLFAGGPTWHALIVADAFVVDVLLVAVVAAVGIHLEVRKLLSAGGRAVAIGGSASVWMASLTLAMITATSRGAPSAAALVGLCALLVSYVLYRVSTRLDARRAQLRQRFETGAPLSLAEATTLLDALDQDAALDDPTLRRVLRQLHPSIGELIPVRESPLGHGVGCRWITYWEGRSGWALVAVCREPGSATPIHAHPHRLLGKAIEGMLEELRFREDGAGVALVSRKILSHNDLVETDGLSMPHIVRALGAIPAIDLQLRGPEVGDPGKRYRTASPVDLDHLLVGERVAATMEIDDRPGQSGDGARAGRSPLVAPPV
jgi:uncharacterized integral membrane protein (TIGR00698 family)